MKPTNILIVILLLLFPACMEASPGSVTPEQEHIAALDIYHLQLSNNTYLSTALRKEALLKTANIDNLLTAYATRGMGTAHGTVSLLSYLTYMPSVLTYEERQEYIQSMYPLIQTYNSKSLELAIDLMKAFYLSDVGDYDEKMEAYERLLRKARKYGDAYIQARALHYMWVSSYQNQNYARSFTYARRAEEALARVDNGYPYLSADYFQLGSAYYAFKDYDRAIALMHKAASVEGYRLRPWNYLAIYHQMNNNLDSAAYYHRVILESSEALIEDPMHLAIAISNLGRIEMQRGNYPAAIVMLEAGLDHIKDRWDMSFCIGVHISLGECYLEKGDTAATRQHIIDARRDIDKLITADRQNRLKALYALESRYYARTGRHDLERAFQDSALVATREYEQFSGRHIILLGEQQLQDAEAQLQREEIEWQRNIILYAAAALVLISIALLVIVRLYRRRDAAYKKLAQKAKEWGSEPLHPGFYADDTTTLMESKIDDSQTSQRQIDAEDLHIIELANHQMTTNCAYREAGLTMDVLADRLGIRRNTFSRAINRVTGGNFSQYINSYRIKEAVRIISANDRSKLYIDELYEQVGFNNRSSFYRAFKQFTGLSPLEFQKKSHE